MSKYIVFKGTTGKPKGVTLSHHNLVNNANQIGVRIGYSDKVGYRIGVNKISTRLCLRL